MIREEGQEIRILVALEDDYRAYRDVLTAGIRILRPNSEVENVNLNALEKTLESFDPHVLIYCRPQPVDSADLAVCVELSIDPVRPTKIKAGERYRERTNPTLEELLDIVDEIVGKPLSQA